MVTEQLTQQKQTVQITGLKVFKRVNDFLLQKLLFYKSVFSKYKYFLSFKTNNMSNQYIEMIKYKQFIDKEFEINLVAQIIKRINMI